MSADPLQALEEWAGPLLAQLTPAAQRQLARRIATELRRSQARRIAAQQNPDGSAYAPRKPQQPRRSGPGQIRAQRGKVKAMFVKLRMTRHLRVLAEPQGAAVGFTGRAARIARVHQYGLRDAVRPGGPSVEYARRELLGSSAVDLAMIRDFVLARVTS